MTDQEFLRRRRMVRLMKQMKDRQRVCEAREAQAAAAPRTQSVDLEHSLQRLKEIADKLDHLQDRT